MERKLTAIFSADVKGYSRLMGEDEEATIRTLTAYREVMTTRIGRHRGRVVDSPGDNLLAEFASVVDAVRCAVGIQQELKTRNAEVPDHRQMMYRIGINLGDVVAEGERLYGDGVNIAARVESLADPGGICISGMVHDHVENKLPLTYESLGEQTVKNIAKPVRVWRVVMDDAATALVEQAGLQQAQHEREQASVTLNQSQGTQARRAGAAYRSWVLGGAGSLLLIVGILVAMSYLSRPPLTTQYSALVTENAQPPSLPLPDKPSIVVLPFVNMSGDPEQEYFSDGMTEDLITKLSKLSRLFVIARNSSFTYKGKAVKVQDVSREMGVRYVLEGSVRKAENQVRITAQLVDALRDAHLWAESYDRELQDIFAVQDEITQQVVTALEVEVMEAEVARVRRTPTHNLTAYDYFLRGDKYYDLLTKEAHAQARQMFEQAIALDPQYTEAYMMLGWSYYVGSILQWSEGPQAMEQAFALTQKALSLNDSLALAHTLLGSIYLWRDHQHEQAIAEGERALTLDPNCGGCYALYGQALSYVGRPQEAIGLIEKGMRLDPCCTEFFAFFLAEAYLLMERYEEAIAPAKRSLIISPDRLDLVFYQFTQLMGAATRWFL